MKSTSGERGIFLKFKAASILVMARCLSHNPNFPPLLTLPITSLTQAKMNVRVQRLFRARKSLPQLLQLPKRLVSTAEASTPLCDAAEGQTSPRPGQPSSEHLKRKPKLFDNDSFKVANTVLKGDTPQIVSSIHPSLQEGYKIGERMKRGKVPRVHNEEGMPMWGEWGISVGFISWQGPNTTTL